jgi:Uma2 family endonuclease
MTTIAAPSLTPSIRSASVSPDDLLAMESVGLFELSDGRLLEKKMGYDANWTAGRLTYFLTAHIIGTGAGDVLPEQSFQCFADDSVAVRRPDVAFIAASRVPSPRPSGHVRVRPDLAVEVTSPNDEVDELEIKLADYRSAGIPLVWVVIPAVQIVRVFHLDGSVQQLRSGDTLTGDPVLPGFSVAVSALFQPVTVG